MKEERKTKEQIIKELRQKIKEFEKLEVDRKQVQEALRVSEERYRVLVENANEAVVVAQDGMLKFSNPKASEITGYSKQELFSKPFVELIHPDDQKMVVDRYLRRLKGEAFFNIYPFKIIDTNGNIKWVEINAVKIDWEGRPATLNFLSDITEYKHAEETFKESQQKFKNIIEHSNELFYIHDTQHKLTYVSPQSKEVLGYTPEEMMIEWTKLTTENPINALGIEITEKTLKTGIRQEPYLLELYKKDRSSVLLEIDESPLMDEEGRMIGIVGAARDVTEKKRVEESLKESEKKFRAITHTAPDAILLLDNEGKISYWNPSAEKMFGYTSEEAMGKEVHLFLAPERYHEGYRKGWAQFKITGQGPAVGKKLEFFALHKDGAEFPIEVSTSAILLGGKWCAVGIIRDISDRKRMVDTLQQSEYLYRTLIENSLTGIYMIRKGSYVFVNDMYCQITGYSWEELKLTDPLDLVAVEEKQRVRNIFEKRLIGDGVPPEYETKMIRKDGTELDVQVRAALILFENEPTVLGNIIDITKSKQAEESLRKSEWAFRQLAKENETVAEIGRIITSTLNIEEVYKRFAERVKELISFDLIGISIIRPEEGIIAFPYIAGISVPGRHSGDRAPLEGSAIEQMLKTGKGLIIRMFDEEEVREKVPGLLPEFQSGIRSALTVPLISRDQIIGGLGLRSKTPGIYTDLHLKLAESIANQIAGAISHAQLFIERKQAEEALKASEEKYRTLVESSSDAILMLNEERKIISVNQAFCRLFGFNKDEIEGKSVRTIHPSDESFKSFGELAYPTVKEEGYFRGEWNFLRKEGTIFPVETVVSTIISPDGSIAGFVSMIRDITERKQTEGKMLALQEQLRQSQKMEAIGRLAGGVAHDFNNLLTVLLGTSQLILLELEKDNPLRDRIEEIHRTSERAATLTQQLLAFSRRQIMEFKVLDLNVVIKNLGKMLLRIIGEDIELVTFFAEDLGKIKSDPGQIEQVVMNLAVNAKDAMPHGGRLIIETDNVELDEDYARSHIGTKSGQYVRLMVSDTGKGISPEAMDKIFEPFFTTKEKGRGTGLGLSTVYGIVKQSGGNIWAYSEPEKGTTFKMYFPRVDEPLEAFKEKIERGEFPRGSETILVVEDGEEVRKFTVRILTKQGYRVLEAPNGEEALVLFQNYKGPIHLMLTDVVMPGMSGRELANALLNLRPELKVIYMSGYTDNAIVHHGILEKGIHYIQKPFTIEGLARKIREVLNQ